MGSSYVRFRGAGFEANDATLEVWLALVVRAVDRLPAVPPWLQEARDDWHVQAREGFGFGIVPDLDRYAGDDVRRELLVGVCEAARRELEAMGPVLSGEVLDALGTGGDSVFAEHVPAAIFVRTARWFLALLRGTLRPEQKDARFPDEDDG
jgi:hypothetical protein